LKHFDVDNVHAPIFHLERTQSTKFRIGVLSMIEAGVTSALRIIRALPPSTT